MDSSLNPFFKPRGVVIVGVSTSPEKLSFGVARNLIASGYQGAIHFVSQKRGMIFDRPIFDTLADVPDPVDLAVLIVPPKNMPETIHLCGQRGIKAAILISSGFREAGAEGAAFEEQCLETARKYGIRLIGPNCIGIIDTHLPLDTTFLQPPMPAQGNIGFVSQSGAFCAAMIDLMRGQGFGFSQIVSLGNQADVNETDALPAIAADSNTRVIVLYMESVSNGRRFVETAGRITPQKPVIVLKVGRSEPGKQAALSHTGALAGSESAFNAAFEKAGILRAESAEQMFDWARAMADCPLPQGPRVAILTNAGGPGVIAADALETNDLLLAQLSDPTIQALSSLLPPAASLHNPVDMLASASSEVYAGCLRILLADSNVDSVLVILPPPPMYSSVSVADALIPVIHASVKPVALALMGSRLTKEALERFEQAHIPTYPFPERAASALGALVRRAEILKRIVRKEAQWISSCSASLDGFTPDELLTTYGIQVAPIKLACSAEQASSIADELGYPVVLKIASPDIPHKSDVSGVMLNITNTSYLQSGYTQLIERVKSARPEARIEGAYVQRQLPQGQEVIMGVVRDSQFGPLVMFGSGGVEVEGLKDVAFSLAPLDEAEAESMLRKTWAGRKLKGFRNLPPCDTAAARGVLVKLSRLALENEQIQEIEINPLRVLSQGAIAVDVRIRFR
jgi:acetyl coenzyme A synthetase (ADP forming)-like protein